MTYPILSEAQQTAILQQAIVAEVSRGARVVTQAHTQAVLEYGRKVNHIGHLLGTVFTCGFWAIAWFIDAAAAGAVYRRVLWVDYYGQVHKQ